MTTAIVDRIVRALLYEGYILYPYRPSVKNRQRWTFGGLYPDGYGDAEDGNGDPRMMQVECLVAGARPVVSATVQFLHLLDRQVGKLREPIAPRRDEEPHFDVVDSLEVGSQLYQTWQEAVERKVSIDAVGLEDVATHPRRYEFAFPASRTIETLPDAANNPAAVLVRNQREVSGTVMLSAEQLSDGVSRLQVIVVNDSVLSAGAPASRDDALLQTLTSTHIILKLEQGAFVSLLEPGDELRSAADECYNLRVWPVLVGDPGETHTLLASPIILYDYPQIAPESPGDLFDSTEIDEILTLRIMTLTDEEKRVAGAVDERARAMLQRTDSLGAREFSRLHGTFRGLQKSDTGDKP